MGGPVIVLEMSLDLGLIERSPQICLIALPYLCKQFLWHLVYGFDEAVDDFQKFSVQRVIKPPKLTIRDS